jgi:hypothetical protein
MRNGRHAVLLEPSRALCGTTPEQFADLLIRLAPLVDAARQVRDERPNRKRRAGGGAKPNPFQLRLFVALTYLKQGSSTRATASIFGIHEKSVRRYRDEIEGLLIAHGFQPPGVVRPIRNLQQLKEYLEDSNDQIVIIDGTEVERSSPKEWEEQKKAWSGKSHGHAVKGTTVADKGGRPLWFEANPLNEGRTHDITMLRQQMDLLHVIRESGVLSLAISATRALLKKSAFAPSSHEKRERTKPSKTETDGTSSIKHCPQHASKSNTLTQK